MISFSTARSSGQKRLFVGGFADRLKGLSSCYWIAFLLGEKLIIDWTPSPDSLSDYYTINATVKSEVEWKDNSQSTLQPRDLVDKASRHEFRQLINLLQSKNNSCIISDIDDFFGGRSVTTNQIFYDIFNHPVIKSELNNHLPEICFKDPLAFAGFTFKKLFTLNHNSTKLNHGLHDFLAWLNANDSNQNVYGFHARLGGDNVTWNDPVMGDLETTLNALASMLKNISQDSRLFICSDSQVFKDKAMVILSDSGIDYFAKKVKLFISTGARSLA